MHNFFYLVDGERCGLAVNVRAYGGSVAKLKFTSLGHYNFPLFHVLANIHIHAYGAAIRRIIVAQRAIYAQIFL